MLVFVALHAALCRDVFTLADLKDDETETPIVGGKFNTWFVSYVYLHITPLVFLAIT